MQKNIRKLSLLLVFTTIVVSCGNPARDIPSHGLLAATQFCFEDDACELEGYGRSTTKLPYSQAEGVFGRWCVEVQFTRGGEKGSGIVMIEQHDPDPMSLNWTYAQPIFNADCNYYE